MPIHQPKKRFGQHFLHDQSVISRIVHAIAPQTTQHFVEIGPGQGALTEHILPKVKTLDVIELDRDLIEPLKQKCESLGQLTIHQADVLEVDFKSLAKNYPALRVIGNLPYNISTPLLFHLFEQIDVINDMCFMLQKEVAERLAADVGTKNYGRLSIMAQYHCDIELLFDVPPEAFLPPPKVNSSILRLVPHKMPPYPCQDKALLDLVVKQAFSQRRKTLRNALKTTITPEALEQLNIDPSLRPERISIEEFVRIANFLAVQ